MPYPRGKDLLRQAVTLDNLRRAWRDVRENRGAAGGDLVTLVRFESRLELNLLHLAERVNNGSYQPGRVRVVSVFDGRKDRAIAIWCVADRVLQRAVTGVIEPLFEAMFLPCSYGYRHNRCVGDAVRRVLALREQGYQWIVDGDIKECFPSLDHGVILFLLRQRLVDQDLLDLIAQWLPLGRARSVRRSSEPRGISLGAVISPLLCNICLHQLDRALQRAGLQSVRYADDFIILCRRAGERGAALDTARSSLQDLKLEINPVKTRLTGFDDGFTFLGVTFRHDKYWFNWHDKKVEGDDLGEGFPLEVDGYD